MGRNVSADRDDRRRRRRARRRLPRSSHQRSSIALLFSAAAAAFVRGTDVYLFLIGMMALAAYARIGGIFTWVAAFAVRAAGRSRARLFGLIYLAGIGTTAVLSNDATIVVLTPAVIEALREYDAPPLPYVVACALVANAASCLLPISNPANLLVFAGHMPALGRWLIDFTVPSLAAIAVTFAVLRMWYRRDVTGRACDAGRATAPRPSRIAVLLLAIAGLAIVATSAREGPIGAAAFACGTVAFAVTVAIDHSGAREMVREIAWPIVALTAALFVVVGVLDAAGGLAFTHAILTRCGALTAPWSQLATGFAVAVASNVANNLPVGLNAGETLAAMKASPHVANAVLIGINLGPNATVYGSLATLLWLRIVRRAGIAVSPLGFSAVGLTAAVPALAAALLTLR